MATLLTFTTILGINSCHSSLHRPSRSNLAFSVEFQGIKPVVAVPPTIRWSTTIARFRCVANSQSAERLREQLEALQQEAHQVRARANSARLRFMRLSHVVEQLRERAAMDVRKGNEDSARALLTEKHKVMRALEASRQRAELLEQLANKLNVAISMKETVLIEALSSAPLSRPDDDDNVDASHAVHHVSPRREEEADEDVIRARAGLSSPQVLNVNEDRSLG